MIQAIQEYLKTAKNLLLKKSCIRQHSLALIGILGIILAVSCTPDYDSANYLTEVLDPQECNMPCWQGIVPEKSSREDLLDVLEQLPDGKVEDFRQKDMPNDGVRVLWKDRAIGSAYNAFFEYEVLKYIESQPFSDITLSELVSVIGTPQQYIAKLATGERTILYVDLFYEDVGVYAFLWNTSPDEVLIRTLESCETSIPLETTIQYLRIMPAQRAENMMETIPILNYNYSVDELRLWSDKGIYLSACQK